VTHGAPAGLFPLDVWLSDDPDLALAVADMAEWHDAHPCECEAMCECERPCCGDPADCNEDCA
jgi:hypothetical protein